MEKQKEVKIEKMILNIEGEKVTLTIEQAKKLKEILNELFGKEVIKEIVEKHHYHDWNYYPQRWTCTTSIPSNTLPVFYCSDTKSLEITC